MKKLLFVLSLFLTTLSPAAYAINVNNVCQDFYPTGESTPSNLIGEEVQFRITFEQTGIIDEQTVGQTTLAVVSDDSNEGENTDFIDLSFDINSSNEFIIDVPGLSSGSDEILRIYAKFPNLMNKTIDYITLNLTKSSGLLFTPEPLQVSDNEFIITFPPNSLVDPFITETQIMFFDLEVNQASGFSEGDAYSYNNCLDRKIKRLQKRVRKNEKRKERFERKGKTKQAERVEQRILELESIILQLEMKKITS